jgi:hypothetical protein
VPVCVAPGEGCGMPGEVVDVEPDVEGGLVEVEPDVEGGFVELVEFEFVEFALFGFVLDEPGFLAVDIGGTIVPLAATQVTPPGLLGGPVCGFPAGVPWVAGVWPASFCGVVPVVVWGVLWVPGPAALVVIGVGGPIVVGGGVMFGLAGAVVLAGGAAFGVAVWGGVVACGTLVARCPAAQTAVVSSTSNAVNRIVISNTPFRKHHCTRPRDNSDYCFT